MYNDLKYWPHVVKLTPSTLLEVAIESVPVRRILEPQFLYGVDRAKAGTMVQDRPTRPFVTSREAAGQVMA